MSFQIRNQTEGTLEYNYYRTTIYKYKNTLANSGYIKASIHAKPNEPNIYILENGYIATELYIVRPIQVIDGVDYDATLVIEHKSVTNKTDPLYVCIPLKHSPNTRNEIDDVIDGKTDIDLVLNALIQGDNAILYENHFITKSTVVILTTPILVGSDLSKLRTGDIYIAPYSDIYTVFTLEPILGNSENIVEGLENQTMAGYCTPISETDPDATDAANIMLDANSGLMVNSAVNTTLATATNFFGFFLLMLFAVFATPAAYRFLLLELVLDNETFSPQMKLNRMSAVDMATSIIFFVFSFSFINYGIANGSTGSLAIGFYVFLFFLTSLIVLQYRRIFNEKQYLEQFGIGTSIPSFKDVRNDMGGLLFENIRELFYKKTRVNVGNNTYKTINTFSSSGIMLLAIYLTFYYTLYTNGMLGSSGTFFFISIPIAFFFLSWYLVVLINHWWYVYMKNGTKSSTPTGPIASVRPNPATAAK